MPSSFYWPGNIHVCSQTYVCSNKIFSPFFHLITNSEEKALTSFEKFCVWIGVMEKPTPCPGIEDLHAVSSEKINQPDDKTNVTIKIQKQ